VHPLLLAFGSGIGWGTADFLAGLSARTLPLLVVSSVSQFVGLLFTGALIVIRGGGPEQAVAIAYGLAGGVAGAIGLSALYRGLAIGRMGIVAPTAALSGTVPVAWGLLRGDRPSSVQLVGVGLAIGGVVLAARTTEGGTERRTAAGVGLALVAALFLGVLVALLDEAGRSDPLWGVLMVRVGALALLGGAVIARRPSFAMSQGQAGRLGLVGLLDNGSNLAFALAAEAGGLLTLTSVLGSMYPVSTVVLARAVLHERLARHQTVGVVAALTGVGLIAAG
jgi:drug/metabolite transporter (DMT)-like permease